MNIYDIDFNDILKAVESEKEHFDRVLAVYSRAFGQKINFTPDKMAEDLSMTLQFAKGQKVANHEELIDYLSTLFDDCKNELIDNILKAALARDKVLNGQPLTSPELGLLAGMTRVGINYHYKQGTLKGTLRGDKKLYYDNESVVQFLKEYEK